MVFFAAVYTWTFRKTGYSRAVYRRSVPVECIRIEIPKKQRRVRVHDRFLLSVPKNSIYRHLRCSVVHDIRRVPNCEECGADRPNRRIIRLLKVIAASIMLLSLFSCLRLFFENYIKHTDVHDLYWHDAGYPFVSGPVKNNFLPF